MKWSIPERVVAEGRSYVEAGRVLSVTADKEAGIWYAEVLGDELYSVELDGSPKENDVCTCEYWKENRYCKHTVAAELYLKEQGLSRIMNQKSPSQLGSNRTTMFTRGFQAFQGEKMSAPRQKSEKIVVHFFLEAQPYAHYYTEDAYLSLFLKIGYDAKRTYIVKNIHECLDIFEKGGTITLNKQHTFQLNQGTLEEQDYQFLKELLALSKNQRLYNTVGLPVRGQRDKRYLLFPVQDKTSLLTSFLATSQHTLQIEDTVWTKDLTVIPDETPLVFTLEGVGKKQFRLTFQTDFLYYLESYQWGITKTNLYQFSMRQQEIYHTLKQLLKRFDEPVIDYEQGELSTLFNEVIPVLKEIATVEISPEVQEIVTEVQLKTILTFRKKKAKIVASVDFIYGEQKFSTDQKESTHSELSQEIIRDSKQEKRVFDLFRTLDYRKNQQGFEKELPEGSALYRFFKQELPIFQQNGEVRLGKQLRQLFLNEGDFLPEITVGEGNGWLDVQFDVTGIAENDVEAVLEHLLANDSFATLSDGRILALDDEAFVETSQALQTIREQLVRNEHRFRLPNYQALHLQEKLGNKGQYTQTFQQLVYDLTHPESFQVTIPTNLKAVLREYQLTGFKWLKMLSRYQFGGVLADEMGLGKTLQVITYLLSEKNEQGQLSALVVAPASLIYNWQAEIQRFAPSLTTQVVTGSAELRKEQIANNCDIRITSYNSFRQDVKEYQQLELNHLIMDEAQMVKNSGTKTAKALRELVVPQRFAVSGTPIENNLDELWALFQNVMPGLFPTKAQFRKLSAEEIAKMVQPFVLRREKQTVLQDLPDKIESTIFSSLTEPQKTVYLAYLRQMREEVSGMDSATFKKNRISILAGLTRLRQICCDPRLFIEDYHGGSGKLEQAKDLILSAKENKRRILLFSQFTSMLTILQEELEKEGISSFYLRGSTPPKERLEMVDAFNDGEKDVFLISLKAGGTGLNLTGADTVILYDLWWNPAVEEQAAGRAHRMGQKKVVEVWRLIAEGTIEEQIDHLQQQKRELFQKVIQGNEQQVQQLTEEDIRLILSMGE